jgi:hypothetical protein
VAFREYSFDPRRLWEPAANDEERPAWAVALKKKACRKRVKAEIKPLRKSDRPRDAIRVAWVAARCSACGKCPKMAKGSGI